MKKSKTSFYMNNLLKKSINKYQKTQDSIYEIQKISNEVRTSSKKAIALLRRDNTKESKKIIKKIENFFRLINKTIKRNKDLINQSFYKEAVEEYVEAITFYNFLTKPNKGISKSKFVEVKPEEIIAGICDFTGELLRRTITIASVENFKQIGEYKKIIENIAEQLTKIGFKGKLRQKYDEVERNLRKIEDIIYDIKLKK
jgi:predicted translin family RNA/ssDNA-binding protein